MWLLMQQFLFLLWKCLILRKRHYISTAFEVILPLLTSALIAYSYAKLGGVNEEIAESHSEYAKEASKTHYYEASIMWNPTVSFRDDLDSMGRVRVTVLYAPKSEFTEKIASEMKLILSEVTQLHREIPIIEFDSEADILAFYANATAGHQSDTYFAVIFENTESLKKFRYTIRCPQNEAADPSQLYPYKYRGGARWYNPYQNQFSTLQIWLNEAYLRVLTKDETLKLKEHKTADVKAFMYPYPAYEEKPKALMSIVDQIPLIVVFGFIVTAPIILKRLADEKTSRCREMFRLMGLNDWIFWGSTFVNYFVIYAVQSVILTFLYTYNFSGISAVINYANPGVIFLTFLMYGVTFIMQAMLISIPFNRPVIGVIVVVLYWMVSYIVPIAFLDPSINNNIDIKATDNWRVASCLLPNMALYFIFRVIGQKEIYQTGSRFNNLFEVIPAFGKLSHGLILMMMLLSCVISAVLIWYLEAVWPWQYGVPKPFYFPLLPSYWCGRKRRVAVADDSWRQKSKFFERQLSSAEVSIAVKHLRKEFGVGFTKKIAINDATLDINRGQITVLLGHNGAGKTTMMNIITGMFTSSAGEVIVDGYDISSETKAARKSMSLCPQHNVLYDELTVAEHLKLYAAIKGTPWSALNSEVQKCLHELNLADKANRPSTDLSGGMKRKLNLGIALIGGTRIVILDEPTSGMDPDARRTVWDLLQSIRKERTILITTHFMEEADALADRIAIMVAGEVRCCGTPMFLKAAFGSGYQLRIAKGDTFKRDKVEACVLTYFPHAAATTDTDTEVVYRLEDSERNSENKSSDNLPQFFEAFDAKKNEIGVSSCGLSVTTIEDVFLGVHSANSVSDTDHDEFPKPELNNQIHGDSSTAEIAGMISRSTGFLLLLQQLKGLLLKRCHFSKRYLPMVIFQLIIPGLLFWLLLYLDAYSKTKHETDIKFNLNLKEIYGNTKAYFQYSDSTERYRALYAAAAKDEGVTTIFIDSSTNFTQTLINASEPLTITDYINTYIVGASIVNSSLYSVWYSSQVNHGLPASINILYNTLLRELTLNSSDYSISLSVALFQEHHQQDVTFGATAALIIIWAIIVPMTVPFIAASYVLFPIHERESKSKLLQLMSGVNPILFWFANFLYDFITHMLCCYIIFGIFAMMDRYGLFIAHFSSASALFVLLLFFGLACIPLAYIASFLFKSTGTGFAILVIIYLIFGVVLSPVDRALKVLWPKSKYNIFQWCVSVSPILSLSKGILKLYESAAMPSICDNMAPDLLNRACEYASDEKLIFGCCKRKSIYLYPFFNNHLQSLELCGDQCYVWKNPYTWSDGILPDLLMLFLDAMLFTLVLFALEMNVVKIVYSFIQSKRHRIRENIHLNSIEDVDVHEERRRVEDLLRNSETPPDSLIVQNLKKQFVNRCLGCLAVKGSFVAVKNLTFAVHKEECFGLLGVNGAGKTTTFRMLVGDLSPTQGSVYCCGYSLDRDLRSFQQNIGYCPQFDALLDKLTGSETLYLFGRLRGIRESDLSHTVKELVVMTDLIKHADKPTETYSGGTRRKLSLAIALIGNPKLLFLDEPSSGVDPGARRKMWKTLAYIKQHYGCSLVLTSHSMDECEALCGRIAIMVNGEFKCLGNFQHLRAKFAQGFTLKIKIKRAKLNPEFIESVKNHVATTITSAMLKDLNETVLEYHITDVTLPWSKLFAIMSRMKEEFDLEDYTISDTTLEQIFISFARQQYLG